MNIWGPLIGDKLLICWKEKVNVYDPHVVAIIQQNAGAGYEIPVCFVFQRHVKGVEWIKKADEAEKKVQACFKKCVKNAV